MHSYNDLFEHLVSNNNIKKGIVNASKRKRDRKSFSDAYHHQSDYVPIVKEWLLDYHNDKHKPVQIYDGIKRKKRTIVVPTFKEQIVHHCVVNILKPIFMRGMYEHSYGSIPGRGSVKASYVIRRYIKNNPKECKYCLKMDIKHFFDTVDHNVLKAKLAAVIKDNRFLAVLYEIINATDKGIPLGFYTSQWLANWFLQGLDHYIKEELKASLYIRYMDDMVIFGSNKKELHKKRNAIETYLNQNLNLEMKENWQVFRFDYKDKGGKHHGRFLDFMGFKFYCDHVGIRKTIFSRICRKAIKFSKQEHISVYEARQMLSYLGWIKHTDSYNAFNKYVAPKVSVKLLRIKISREEKKNRDVSYKNTVSRLPSGEGRSVFKRCDVHQLEHFRDSCK